MSDKREATVINAVQDPKPSQLVIFGFVLFPLVFEKVFISNFRKLYEIYCKHICEK